MKKIVPLFLIGTALLKANFSFAEDVFTSKKQPSQFKSTEKPLETPRVNLNIDISKLEAAMASRNIPAIQSAIQELDKQIEPYIDHMNDEYRNGIVNSLLSNLRQLKSSIEINDFQKGSLEFKFFTDRFKEINEIPDHPNSCMACGMG